MKKLSFLIFVALLSACGPVAGPVEEQCEEQGGEWLCDENTPGGRERCWCDIAPEDVDE